MNDVQKVRKTIAIETIYYALKNHIAEFNAVSGATMVSATQILRGNVVAGPHFKVSHLSAPSVAFYAPAA
jgi:hypothetical protein